MWFVVTVAVLIAGLLVIYIAYPIWRSRSQLLVDDNHPVADLLQRKDAALRAIKELEFDFTTGKLSAEDYERINQRLRQQATALLRQIEVIAPNSSGLDDELEVLIAERRKTTV